MPGGAKRNFDSFGHKVSPIPELWQQLLCDPQTSGGLLLAVAPEAIDEFLAMALTEGLTLTSIGECLEPGPGPAVQVL